MLVLAATVSCLTGLPALAQKQTTPPAEGAAQPDPHQAAAISGTWSLPDQHDSGVTFTTKLSFFRSQEDNVYTVHEAVVCSRGNKSLSTQAEAPVKTSKTEITILEKGSYEHTDGDIQCQALITPGTLRYKISADGKTMVLTKPGEPSMILKREK